jgi:TetR/AcrR family transcriptional regulator
MTKWKKAVPNAQQQRDLKRDILYREAAAAFRRNGYHGTSLTDVADQLGVSKATLYNYAENKQDLFFQCHLAAAQQAIDSICRDQTLTGLERLRRSISDYIASIIGPESLSVVILEERSLSEDELRQVIEKRDEFERELRSVVAAGIADGTINRCDPKFAVFCITGAANWVTKWYRPDGPWTIEDVARGAADLLIGGLGRDPSPPERTTLLFGERG